MIRRMEQQFIYSGTSNPALATALAGLLDIPEGSIERSSFENGETRIRITDAKIPNHIILVQSFSHPVNNHIVEYCLIADALRRMGGTDITAVIPFLGYSKQDKVFRTGEPLSIKVIAQILQVIPVSKIIVFDLHNPAILGFFDVPVVNLSARPLFLDYFKPRVTENSLIVAPDAGSVKNSSSFASELSIPIAYVDKKRDLATGKVTISGISRTVKNADVVIIDDMIATGSTVIEIAHYLKKNGAHSITIAATHHLYLPGVQEKILMSPIDHLVVTDTIHCPTH